MAKTTTRSSVRHPAVIVTCLIIVFLSGYLLLARGTDPRQQDIDTLRQQVVDLTAKSLPSVIQDWRRSTAYVECYWADPATGEVSYKQSGSGLLLMVDTLSASGKRRYSIPNVVTNLHVIHSAVYGAAQECDIGFPDNRGVFYTTAKATDTNGNSAMVFNYDREHDVAYLLGLTEMGGVPPVSLESRAKTGSFACAGEPSIGDPLVILGYPSYGTGAERYIAANSNLEVTATEGIVSGRDDVYYTTSAKLEHGNSGGLAIDMTNDCYLGIPTAAVSGETESLGRIFPASYVVKWLRNYSQ
jgi:hypothetical protein